MYVYIYLCINIYGGGGGRTTMMGTLRRRSSRWFEACGFPPLLPPRLPRPAGPGQRLAGGREGGVAGLAAAPRSPGALREKAGFSKRITRSSGKVAASCGGERWKLPDLSFFTACPENPSST